MNIPQINIMPEAEEDDDNAPNISEALTDVEDLYDEPPMQIKSKLKIKLCGDPSLTDMEDFEASSEDETIVVKHDSPVDITDLDLEAPLMEESYKKQKTHHGKRKVKTHFATKQKSFYHSQSEEENDEGVVTDSEAYETENDLDSNESIPDTEVNLDNYKLNHLVEDYKNPSATSDYSDTSVTPKNYLSLKRCDQDGGHTDIELLKSDSDSDVDVKKTTVRRRRPKGRKPSSTEPEDLYFSDDEAVGKVMRRHKKKPKQLLVKSQTMPFDSENEDVALAFPVCKKTAKKNQVSLRLPDFDTNFETDVEDIEGDADLANAEILVDEAALEQKLKEISCGYEQAKEETIPLQKDQAFEPMVKSPSIEKPDTDLDEFQSDNDCEVSLQDNQASFKIKFSPSNNNIKGSSKLSLPLNQEEPITDCENLDSSPEHSKSIPMALIQGQETEDEEMFTDTEPVQELVDITIPPPTRNLVIYQENDSLVPTVRILPIDSLELTSDDIPHLDHSTDEESISEAEEAFDALYIEQPLRAVTPELPIIEGGSINVEENLNKYCRSPIPTDCLTDTEEVYLDSKKRRRAPKFKYMYEKSLAVKNSLSPVVLTDTEHIDLSGDEQECPLRLMSVTPQHMRELGGTTTLRDGSGPFSLLDGLELDKFRVNSPQFITPATTDEEVEIENGASSHKPAKRH